MNDRLLLYILSASALALSFFVYAEMQMVGFPDGHRTELDQVNISLHGPFILINVVFSAGFAYLAFTADAKARRNKTALAAAGYLLFLFSALLVELCQGAILDHGQGG